MPGILIGDKTEEWCGDSESMKVVDECELHMIKRSERIRVNGVKLNKIYLKKPLAYDHPGKTPLLQMCACSYKEKKPSCYYWYTIYPQCTLIKLCKLDTLASTLASFVNSDVTELLRRYLLLMKYFISSSQHALFIFLIQGGTQVVKPSALQIARPVKTTSELAIGSLELECLDNSELLPGVDVIIGTGQTKEMNTIKSIMKGEDEFVRRANFVSPKILMGCTEPHHNCTLLWNLC